MYLNSMTLEENKEIIDWHGPDTRQSFFPLNAGQTTALHRALRIQKLRPIWPMFNSWLFDMADWYVSFLQHVGLRRLLMSIEHSSRQTQGVLT